MSDPSWRGRADTLHEKAAASVGADDFGDTNYLEGMGVLLDALDSRPPPNAVACATNEGLIVGALSARLITQAGWKANPAALEARIEAPVIVIGIPRTGTTALHHLLSLDPQFQGVERWLMNNPIVRPPRDAWEAHPFYRQTVERIAQMRAQIPEVMAAHSSDADEVDECLAPMAQSFVSNWFASNFDAPQYDAWFRGQDETPSFQRYTDVLKLIGLGDRRRWLLKNPSHLFGIDALLHAFPDACVIQTHRHPAQALASLTSLLGGIRELQAGGAIDRRALQAREAEFWAQAARRGMAAQDRRPERFVNVRQGEIRRDPLGVVEAIYRHFGLELSPAAEARMRAWAERSPPEAESRHRYAPVESDAEVAEAFAEYIERYGL